MHIHLPKPLHGWREFLAEVGIIVLGVLIALGAEQLQLLQTVDQLRVHNEMIEGVSGQLLRRIQDLGVLPSLTDTKQPLGSKWSPAMPCTFAREQLNNRVAQDWLTLRR